MFEEELKKDLKLTIEMEIRALNILLMVKSELCLNTIFMETFKSHIDNQIKKMRENK